MAVFLFRYPDSKQSRKHSTNEHFFRALPKPKDILRFIFVSLVLSLVVLFKSVCDVKFQSHRHFVVHAQCPCPCVCVLEYHVVAVFSALCSFKCDSKLKLCHFLRNTFRKILACIALDQTVPTNEI